MNFDVKRVYIHYPFCLTKCHYCNFAAGVPPKEEFLKPYHDALLLEINAYREMLTEPLDSLYFGGGTPSLMPIPDLEAILQQFEPLIRSETEITLEANPETVTSKLAQAWEKLNINRVSLGWQSMNNSILKFLARSGNAEDNIRSFETLRNAGFNNISVDRILSVQHDTEDDFFTALEACMPEHISTYQLTIEEKTVLHAWTQQKKYLPLTDGAALKIEAKTESRLAELGFERYEISNYCRNKNIGRHNTGYWNYDYYLGLGAGAAGFLPEAHSWGLRYTNPFSFKNYLKSNRPAESEQIHHETAVKEALMLGIRRLEGIEKHSFENRLNIKWDTLFPNGTDPQFFDDTPQRLILKHSMIPLANPAVLSLWEALNLSIFS
ncbi:oxygen-independent coproporphyrinogen-3 oxidase [Brevinema andersonii]|uniref:Heme chaperone HemW n=1 Tax=Brevinema andersonii TaxID=34097 RepID=A0A1I1DH04_BREAD|nr:radical SAM family heme chaperone HemW [Brevinema andersonii]SFB71823.1 oxygen-independent coproporphyrinogen-3 oxidase [Brevinema andersonii]